jgi:P27 family predicted phage terminase small subunit
VARDPAPAIDQEAGSLGGERSPVESASPVDVRLLLRPRASLALDRTTLSTRAAVVGMRGRKPTPTDLKVLRGNPGHRPLNVDEPQLPAVPADVFDTPPLELAGDAAACDEWIRLAPMLRAARQVTDAERGSLIALVQQWSRYLEANTKAAAAGMVIKSPSGYPMPNPYLAIANRALAHCMKLWAELGLTPSSRSRVTATPPTSAMDAQKQRYFGAARGR